MVDNLAERVLAAIDDWQHYAIAAPQDAASIMQRCDADRRTVLRHVPRLDSIGVVCKRCHHYDYPARYPCEELLDRAKAYNVPLLVV